MTLKDKIKNLTWFNLVELLQDILTNFSKRVETLEEKPSGGEGGVQSVTGIGVDNIDPQNPVITGGETQDLHSVLTAGNTAAESIILQDPGIYSIGTVLANAYLSVFGQQSNNSHSSIDLTPGGVRFYNGNIGSTSSYFNANLTIDDQSSWNYTNNYFLPKKPVGNYTLATRDDIKIGTTAPSSSIATGTVGEIRVAAGFIYWCTAPNTWIRAAGTTW